MFLVLSSKPPPDVTSCTELPEEALAKGETAVDTVGKLEASLYGARDASANRQEEVNKSVQGWGFTAGRYNPCAYFHKKKGIRCLVHGDDFVCAGSPMNLVWLEGKLRERFEIKVTTVGLDSAAGEVKEATILNRIGQQKPHGSMRRTSGTLS